jgi:GGDEF domain-containing protein
VLLPSAGRRDAQNLVRRMQKALEEVRVPAYPEVALQVSFGVASSHERFDLGRVVARADKALYRTKQRRSN